MPLFAFFLVLYSQILARTASVEVDLDLVRVPPDSIFSDSLVFVLVVLGLYGRGTAGWSLCRGGNGFWEVQLIRASPGRTLRVAG